MINRLEEFTFQFSADVDDNARTKCIVFIQAVLKIASQTLIQVRLRSISRVASENYQIV